MRQCIDGPLMARPPELSYRRMTMKPRGLICLFAFVLMAAEILSPQVPDILKAPETEVVLLKALGNGKQIYACKAKADNAAQFDWVLARPDADLLDEQGAKIGKHYEGPTWEATDGSKVIGQVQQRANAPRPDAVPWLLLRAKTTQGAGTFGHVTYIQRVNTVGGVAPAGGCDKERAGAEVSIDYHADYYFYGPRP
jgi:hypothetical protein